MHTDCHSTAALATIERHRRRSRLASSKGTPLALSAPAGKAPLAVTQRTHDGRHHRDAAPGIYYVAATADLVVAAGDLSEHCSTAKVTGITSRPGMRSKWRILAVATASRAWRGIRTSSALIVVMAAVCPLIRTVQYGFVPV